MYKGTVYSYSRLDKYETCPFSYHCTYNLKLPEVQSDWGEGGTWLHEAVEQALRGNILKEEASDYFYYGTPVLSFDNMKGDYGERWVNECVKFLDNLDVAFSQFDGEVVEMEEYAEITMGGRKLKLYSDLLLFDGKDYYVWDWKTSGLSGFEGKKFQKKKRQLYVYARYVKEKYGKYPKSMSFYMARYNKKLTEEFRLKEYNKVDKWVRETAEKIESDTTWEERPNFFWCRHVCGQSSCEHNGGFKQ